MIHADLVVRPLLALSVLFLACSGQKERYPDVATVESRTLAEHPGGVQLRNGGYGSAIARVPGRPGFFYLLVDRGPNVDTTKAGEKAFLVPQFTPHIGVFEQDGTSLKRVGVIELKDPSGRNLSGLPDTTDHPEVIERPVDTAGRPLQADAYGIDSEGLVALADGTFWVADEYGPNLIHFDASGREVERLNPFRSDVRGRSLPRVLGRRRPNYGIEGLTVTPDAATLVAILQSALDNPNHEARSSRTTRLVMVNLMSGATRQFVYLRERPEFSVSDVTALSDNVFLVIERDDNFPGDPAAPSLQKRVYRVDISHATDVSDPANAAAGKLFGDKTLEQLDDDELATAGVTPAVKTLAVDLLALPQRYVHDKPEGLVLIDNELIAISNDDDFGIDSNSQGTVVVKVTPATNTVDQNEIHFIPIRRD